jgi:REP element-mobilizing transposase RayT
MGSKLRVQAPDVLYHVVSRGVDRQMIFGVVDGDRFVFMALLANTVRRYEWNLHAYCLMGNHFHLVLDTPNANLGRGMQYLKSSYALWFNALRGREGHLFERPYYSQTLDYEAHLFAICRYTVLNPVRAGLCLHPADWPWSSYRATAGIVQPPEFLCLDLVHEIFGGGGAAAGRHYAQAVAELPVSLGRALPQR